MFDRSQAISRVLTLTALTLLLTAPARAGGYVVIGEERLRKLAISFPMPEYPRKSKQNRATGVSVTKFFVDESGNVESIEVLQAPDRYIEASLVAAINKWKFQPYSSDGQTKRILGKLTFYFALDRGRGRVENPRFSSFPKQRQP